MKKTWKKLIALCCAASMMMTLPGSVVLADEVESPAEEISIDEAEMPAEDISIDEVELSAEEGLIDEVEMPAEEVPADEVEAPAEEIPVYEDSLSEEVVGAEGIEVGNGVTATFDEDTGAVVFTSDHGSLWNDWVDELGVDRDEILSIEVASGKVYLQGDNSEMFAGLTNLTSIDLSSFDTSGSMNMVSMFEGCSSLEELDFSSLKTSNVRKTGYMFLGCSSLSKLNLSGFNTSNVNDMEAMFADCSSLEELDLSSFDTSNVRKMGFMFSNCGSLSELNLSGFKTSNVDDMDSMFNECTSLTRLDLGRFDTANVEYMCDMFMNCSNLTELIIDNFDTVNVTDMSGMFYECGSLTDIKLDSFDTLNVTDMSVMFTNCSSLRELDLSSFDTSNVTDMTNMFYGCSGLKKLDLSSFDTTIVDDISGMLDDCTGLIIFETPHTTAQIIELPIEMYDVAGQKYTEIPEMSESITLSIAIDIADCEAVVDPMEFVYDGEAKEPTVTVSYENVVLSEGTDYSVTYTKNTDAGTANAKVTAIGHNTGEQTLTFTINKADPQLSFAEASVLKKTTDPAFTNVLTKTTDGAVTFESSDTKVAAVDNASGKVTLKGAGTATITAKAAEGRNYKAGSASYTLTIVIDITDCEISVDPTEYVYDGKAKEPSVTVSYENTVLSEGTDYSVTYTKNTDAGTANAKVTAIGHNTGEQTLTFTINKADPQLSFAEASVSKKTTDPAFTNVLTKTTDGAATFESSDTKVAAVDSASGKVTLKGAGTATITVKAAEGRNYKAGSASYTLTVTAPAPTPTPKPTSGFSDVQDPKHAYYKAIYWAAGEGITKGYPDGTFGIDNNCTRGEMMMFLWRYAGKPAPKNAAKSPFKDVPTNHTFFKAILWGSQKGITKGYSDGTFGINRNVTRGEAMMFLWRLKGKPNPKAATKSPFKDVPTNHVFYKAILWGSQNKITTGYTNGENKGKFMVNQNCSRGQIVTFLYRAK